MEALKVFFDSFKEFIWDIIGYLLPGSFMLMLLSICINSKYFLKPELDQNIGEFYSYSFILAAYLLGYVSYGFSCLKDDIFKRSYLLKKYSYIRSIETSIAERKAFILSRDLVSKALKEKGVSDDLRNSSVRDLRNIAMSFNPESDQKIYTFMFRSELSNQIANISLVIGGMGLCFTIYKVVPLCIYKVVGPLYSLIGSLPFDVFKTDIAYVILYLSLLFCYVFLIQTRNRFYAIALGLPFSIFTANAIKK